MSFQPDITFIKDHAAEHLEQFSSEARTSKGETAWRCLYAALNPDITKDQAQKNIAAIFLESAFDKAFEVKAFWLASGHLFIFFQGPVRKVIKDYESFLESLRGAEARAEYHFFWKLDEFWGYFDEVLAGSLKDKPSAKLPKTRNIKAEIFPITEDLQRQRTMRYKPLLLIVEDDRVTRHMLQAAMEKYCDIAVAWSAEQAVRFYQTMLPNIAFLDIQLPDGDGRELAELFCAHDGASFVVMISGALDNETIARCIKAGVKGTIAKPAKEKQLLGFIDQYRRTRLSETASG